MIGLAAIIPVCAAAAGVAAHPVTAPFTWRESFHGAGLSQFASYPPVQDAGYDPSILPVSDSEAPGGRALMRVLKPVRSGPVRFGFIRRLDLVAAANASLSFSYRLDGASPGDSIEIGIAAANGRRYAAVTQTGTSRIWHRVRLGLADLRDESRLPPPAGVGIEALYLVAGLPHADPDATYRFLIGDLLFQAARGMRFQLLRPPAVALEPRQELFATINLEAGGALGIEANSPVALARAECVVKDQDGKTTASAPLYDDATHGDHTAHDGIWTNEALPDLPNHPGVYKLSLNGVTANGDVLVTTVRLVRTTSISHVHPRLYFSPADRAKLAARTRDPKYAALWQQFVTQAKLSRNSGDLSRGAAILPMLDSGYLLPTLPGYFDLITKAGNRIQYNALVAYVSGDAEARGAAKEALLTVMKWDSWAPPWFPAHGQATYYPAGQLTAQAAFAYDALYDQLSPEERKIVREGLIRKGILPAYQEYVLDDRVIANTSNWIAHSVAGSLLAAAVVKGDNADPDLDLYINGLLDKFEAHIAASYLPSGSYGEGISYQEFDLETLAPALTALNRVFGLDYWGSSYVKDSLWYPLSTLADPISGCLDMGDTHCPGGHSVAPVVAQSRNPVFRWYQNHFAPSSFQDFLFADDTLKSETPKSPGSRYFPRKGAAVFRTGWKPNDAILLFRAGPDFNHNHADQGSFLLRALGENLVTEAGYADYYKDPYYDTYFKQAAGHNTVLVDGDPASQEVADTLTFAALHEYPRIVNVVTSADFDAVDSELQQVYRGRLKRFVRRVVFLKPDYVVVYDELVPRGSAAFDWLLHLPDVSQVVTEADTAIYRGDTASLAVRFLSPAPLRLRVSEGHLPYTVFNPVAPAVVPLQPAVLNASTAASSGTIRFLAVLAPARSSETARRRIESLRRLDTPDWIGVELDGPVNHRLLFRKGPAAQPGEFDSWSTDAAAWSIRRELDRPQLLAGLGVTSLKRGSETWFSSERPASFAASYENGRITLNVYSAVAQTVRLHKPDGQMAQVTVEPGSHEFEFTWEDKR